MIALIEEHREEIAALCRQYGVERLEVFGSAATGAFNFSTSDIDFIVQFMEPDKPGIARLYIDFSDALERQFERAVDVIIDQPFRNPYFAQSVAESRHLIYEQSIGLHMLLENH